MKNILLLISACFLIGCQNNKAKVDQPKDVTTPAIASIDQSTNSIVDKAGEIESFCPDATPQTTVIKTEAASIDNQASIIAKANQDQKDYLQSQLVLKDQSVQEIKGQMAKLEQDNKKLTAALAKANEDSNKWLKKFIAVAIFAGGIGTTVTFALFLLGRIQDITVPILCAAGLIGAIFLQFVLAYVIYIGVAVTLVVGGLILYRVFNTKKTIEQNVLLIENIKKVFEFDEDDHEVFKKLANDIQSDTTKQTVKRVRQLLGLDK